MADNPLFEDGVSYSVNEFSGDGATTTRNINFAGGYLRQEHVKAFTTAADGSISITSISFIGPNQVQVSPATPIGSKLTVYRDTPKENPTVSFNNDTIVNDQNLNALAKQSVFVSAEMMDRFGIVADQAAEALVTANSTLEAAAAAEASAAQAVIDAAAAVVTADNVRAEFDALEASIGSIADDLPGLAALAELDTDPYGAGVLALTNAASLRAYAGAQAYSSNLDSLAAQVNTSYGRGLLNRADAPNARAYLDLIIGTNVQAYSSNLASLDVASNPFGRSLLNLTDAAAGRAALGVTVSTSGTSTPTFTVDGGGASGAVYHSDRYCQYTRVGDCVHFSLTVRVTDKGSLSSGVTRIASGIPLTALRNVVVAVEPLGLSLGSANTSLYARVEAGTSNILLLEGGGGSSGDLDYGRVNSNANLKVSGHFFV